ncbi:MAG: stage 0 sporulation protein, partial [Planctomycetaceae bacterium]|nr:stage 0 sporulation protein [Planctomycetaceae bacterium]
MFRATPSLPFEHERQLDPRTEGVARLKGAHVIDITRIEPDPEQPRREFHTERLQELTASVRERGIRQPIHVWYNPEREHYQIISGERRFRAATAAGLSAIPCIIQEVPAGTASSHRKELLVEQIIENWQRVDLQPFELSDTLIKLRDDHGLSQDDIAKLTGKPKSEISRLLSLQKIAPEIQIEIRADPRGPLSRRHLVAVAQVPEPEQIPLVQKIRAEKLSAMETEREATKVRLRIGKADRRGAPSTIRRYLVGTTTVQITFR